MKRKLNTLSRQPPILSRKIAQFSGRTKCARNNDRNHGVRTCKFALEKRLILTLNKGVIDR